MLFINHKYFPHTPVVYTLAQGHVYTQDKIRPSHLEGVLAQECWPWVCPNELDELCSSPELEQPLQLLAILLHKLFHSLQKEEGMQPLFLTTR